MAFIDDIQSRDTVLYPVVIFETSSTSHGDIQISTKPVSIGFYADGTPHRTFSPLLLSSPSIKESIDLENRKYKISNVSLKISNVEYNGERFSDRISSHEKGGALNTEVAIYWISPSVEDSNILFGVDSNDAYEAYKGIIRGIAHDEKTCTVSLEDISQSTLHKDVPITMLSDSDDVTHNYLNKPMPMVYGNVDRSPTIIKVGGDSHMTIHADTPDNNTKINGEYEDGWIINSPLYINTDNRYVIVPSMDEDIKDEFEFRDSRQYINSDGSEYISMRYPINTHDHEDDDSISAPVLPSSVGGIFVSYSDNSVFSDGSPTQDLLIGLALEDGETEEWVGAFERNYTYQRKLI